MGSEARWALRHGSPDPLKSLPIGSGLPHGESLFCELTGGRESWPRRGEPFLCHIAWPLSPCCQLHDGGAGVSSGGSGWWSTLRG